MPGEAGIKSVSVTAGYERMIEWYPLLRLAGNFFFFPLVKKNVPVGFKNRMSEDLGFLQSNPNMKYMPWAALNPDPIFLSRLPQWKSL